MQNVIMPVEWIVNFNPFRVDDLAGLVGTEQAMA